MNRRAFLQYMGLGSTALLVDPTSLLSDTTQHAQALLLEYPKLYFTGFKQAQNSSKLVGQFLWLVEWTDLEGNRGVTPWRVIGTLEKEDLLATAEVETVIRQRLQDCTLKVAQMMDQIVADANRGIAQIGCYKSIPNPDFNPALPATTEWDDDYAVWNPRTIRTDEPVYAEVKEVRLKPYDHDAPDSWDFEKQVEILIGRIGRSMACK